MKILIAEDDPAARRLLTKYLSAKGYETLDAADGSAALRAFVGHDPDLVLLDINMPEMDGWQVLREIRSMNTTPVIILTVHDATSDKVRGLSEGADDYVTKPFDLAEVEARIQAVMRRGTRVRTSVHCGPVSIDDEAKEVRVNGRVVRLSPKEYELLYLLASRPGRVFSTNEILQAVWPDRADEGTSEDVKKYIYFLRGKIEENPDHPRLIVTARGFGYKLVDASGT